MAEKTDYELTAAEARLLDAVTEAALAQAGAAGGSVGGAIGGGIGAGGAGAAGGAAGGRKGGAKGGRFGARFTRPRTAEATVEVDHEPQLVRERATAAIEEAGEVIDDPNGRDDGSIWGIVASGAMNMMPALVRVEVASSPSGGPHVVVRATGKEGLIK
jgi:hypothetical protein